METFSPEEKYEAYTADDEFENWSAWLDYVKPSHNKQKQANQDTSKP